jgi:hypothetical protein
MIRNQDEEVPVRGFTDYAALADHGEYSKDEEEQSTLRIVHKLFKDALNSLDSYHVFDLTETELKLKQQIKAHRLAADILAPLLEALEQALATVDEKFRMRNK